MSAAATATINPARTVRGRISVPGDKSISHRYALLAALSTGRSVLTLLIWGSRISLFVGLSATAISMVIGTLVGLVSGFFTGWLPRLLFRLTEWFLVIPFLPLALALA